ncbi:MAG: GNAT family N-acetyltransferase [Aquificaceae bacterium]|nr:GNAT family N-acetyltransferase [Aquificaceae bacterium]MCS7195896.1 GNAT family N-acetyltransferase [Aquificaceae bacterium]MCX7989626.1 GNAT family N-acetyltransferase [Aquificaceae bacterium]MDW8033083.1 GNAT family N-acetyltransferase [Aquificaceae bacterium]MDW8294814.1 GNAT family N-acetyltransferase [Aquificaceae bacterium]
MKLRRAEERDIKELLEVYLQGYKGLEEYSYTHPEDAQAYLNWLFRRDVAGIWLAEEEGRVVGFLASDGNWFSKREGKVVGAIHELVVLPEYRRRGIGKALVEKALEYFKDRNLDRAELWVGDENRAAFDFYRKLGFEERDRFNYWVRMTKSLN